MARFVTKLTVAPAVLKGYLLEEAVAFLISKAGYRLLTRPEDDPHDLTMRGNGLQVRGRGGLHQADVLGELAWAPAFGNPIRLFVEAKWRGEGRGRLGIPEARHAVGILQDVNQSLTTMHAGSSEDMLRHRPDDIQLSGRGFCYLYRYALCSTAGFTMGAQSYALAHQIALLDLSHADYDRLRQSVNLVGNNLVDRIEANAREGQRSASRQATVKTIRSSLRQRLWGGDFGDLDETVLDIAQPLIEEVLTVSELFVGVSATGFVILLKADNPRLMIKHMRARRDPDTTVHYRTQENGSTEWQLNLHSIGLEDCSLSFSLPDAMLHALNESRESGRRLAAMNFKEQHFSRITVYRLTDVKSLVCSLKLDRDWVVQARNETRRR